LYFMEKITSSKYKIQDMSTGRSEVELNTRDANRTEKER